jgi:hypothetical protein
MYTYNKLLLKKQNCQLIINLIFSFSFENGLPRVFLTIKMGNYTLGDVIIKLRTDVVPKTSFNFQELCDKSKEYSFKHTTLSLNKDRDICMNGGLVDVDGNMIMASAWGTNKYFAVSCQYIFNRNCRSASCNNCFVVVVVVLF